MHFDHLCFVHSNCRAGKKIYSFFFYCCHFKYRVDLNGGIYLESDTLYSVKGFKDK